MKTKGIFRPELYRRPVPTGELTPRTTFTFRAFSCLHLHHQSAHWYDVTSSCMPKFLIYSLSKLWTSWYFLLSHITLIEPGFYCQPIFSLFCSIFRVNCSALRPITVHSHHSKAALVLESTYPAAETPVHKKSSINFESSCFMWCRCTEKSQFFDSKSSKNYEMNSGLKAP